MILRVLRAGLFMVFVCANPAQAQIATPGSGPVDISADDFELIEERDMIVYTGDVNVVRDQTRLRADRLEAYFGANTAGQHEIHRIKAQGDVFYITATEIARGDEGVYDLAANTLMLNGGVVLTRGCDVSTGERLEVTLSSGMARLSGGANDRVRSVFFTDDDPANESATSPQDCPAPEPPGEDPRPFTTDPVQSER